MKKDFFENNRGVIGSAVAVVLLCMMVLGIYLIVPQERASDGRTEQGTVEAVGTTYGDLPQPSDVEMTPTVSEREDGAVSGVLTVPSCGTEGERAEDKMQADDGREQQNAVETPTKDENVTPPTVTWVIQSGSAGLQYRSYGNGTCILEGLGSCTDRCVIIPPCSPTGDAVVAIASGAFAGSAVEAVQIPASVQGIGIGAFEGCLRLVHVSVEENNAAFFAEDGVLYSRDGTTLLVYPMGKRCPAVTVPLSVRYIASGAFLECPSLLCVCYEGSVDDWQRIEIAPGNHCLFTLPMRFETQARKK